VLFPSLVITTGETFFEKVVVSVFLLDEPSRLNVTFNIST